MLYPDLNSTYKLSKAAENRPAREAIDALVTD